MNIGHRVSDGPVAERWEINDGDVTTMDAGLGHVAVIIARSVFLRVSKIQSFFFPTRSKAACLLETVDGPKKPGRHP
jgi:hypothetical protein